MLNGRCGSNAEAYQVPMLRGLGTSGEDKRHLLFDSVHIPPRNDMIRETLDWLDRYLGSMERLEVTDR